MLFLDIVVVLLITILILIHKHGVFSVLLLCLFKRITVRDECHRQVSCNSSWHVGQQDSVGRSEAMKPSVARVAVTSTLT